jgi:hypothetical protein
MVSLLTVFEVANMLRLWSLLFAPSRAREKARDVAVRACEKHLPGEPIRGAVICADEPDRYVIRVFYGNRDRSPETFRLPPWRGCLIVAVEKTTYVDEVIDDDKRYRPTIR